MYKNKLITYFFIFTLLIGMTYPLQLSAATKKTKKHTTHTVHRTVKNKHTPHRQVKKKHKTKKSTTVRISRHASSATMCAPVRNNITKTFLPDYLMSSTEKNLVEEVRNSITTLSYTSYKLGGAKIDKSRGVYVVDCSSYVDHILKSIYPDAYSSLTNYSGSYKPNSHDFYEYFQNLSESSESNWDTIEDVKKLRPGDIIVFRFKAKMSRNRPGHVMIVMDQPIRQNDVFLIRVADSAPSGHSVDTRQPHASGIGIGTLLLKVDPNTHSPYAYAWKVGSRWENNVNFAMARPIDTNS